ncbi:MAG TPA: hypothetical protein VFA33_30500 [Bryobacteraceae bacterium]|nr:hypothetical protein [Bryobacteraceae bacterium]
MTASTHSFTAPADLEKGIKSWRTRALAVGVVALAAGAAGGLGNPDQFFRSYLWAYLFFVGVTIGCMALLMLQYLTGGAWGVVIRRLCEAATRTFPLLLVLFLPVVLGISHLYSWSHPEVAAADEAIRHKQAYLNVPFFLGRAAFYFLGWIVFALLLNKWSLAQDTEPGSRQQLKLQLVSGPGLLFFGLSVTFMAIDWVMSIDPHWSSTMYGLLFIAGEGLSSMAFLITTLVILSRSRPFSEVITRRHLHDLGKLMFAFVMVWAYFSFSQFLIIWAGNLPEEIPWYVRRLHGGWGWVGLALAAFHFAVPFLLLLSRDIKRNYNLLTAVAVWLLVMRMVDLYWLVMPEFRKGEFGVSWMDFVIPIGLGGIWLAAFTWQLPKRPLLPPGELHLEEALAHGRD